MAQESPVLALLEGITRSIHELTSSVSAQNHELCSMVANQIKHQHSNREFKVESVSMPTFHGRPNESVDEFIFEAKIFMNGKNIDYTRPENQGRVVAMLASNLRTGAVSWYHRRIMVENNPISTINDFEQALNDELIPPDQQQRSGAVFRACRQTGHVDDYVARFRKIIAQVREMTQLDKVDRFVEGLKPETRMEINYLLCATLSEAIAAA